ncbi:MAG: O-antigen ligase family protein [Bacteroidota bacterium]
MKKKPTPRPAAKSASKPVFQLAKPKGDLKISFILLLLGYVLLPVVTPNFYTLDTAGPKFLAISLLNLIAFLVLFLDDSYKQRNALRFGFFKNAIGIAFSLLMLITALSFLRAINLNEAILNYIKAITVFASTYILYVIFSSNRKYMHYLAVAFSVMLLSDCVTVFYNMLNYISGDIASIAEIKSVYSNKNVLASALFVKVPAALYLMFFSKGWIRVLGYLTGICAVFATLFMSTRTFYLGLALLVFALFIYALLRFIATKKKGPLLAIGGLIAVFVLAIGMYMGAQKYLFHKNTDTAYNVSILKRLSTIKSDATGAGRFDAWKRSVRLIKENPVLGVGTGNWKVVVLKYENPDKEDFIYMFKNHDDFLEITAETGLGGGLAYLAIYILILLAFIRACLKSGPDETDIKFLFLPAFGILAYSVDALFNFPADRPEIQALYAVYIALATALYGTTIKEGAKNLAAMSVVQKLKSKPMMKLLAVGTIAMIAVVSWLLYLNVISLHFQRYVKEDLNRKVFQHSFQEINAGFPWFPDLTVNGEPVAVNKARYLLNEQKYREAVDLLLPDHSSPYDTRREYFLGMAYDKLGKLDSAIYFVRMVRALKPLNASSARMISSMLWDKGQKQEAINIIDTLLTKTKYNADSWLQAANFRLQDKQYDKALAILDLAVQYVGDTSVTNARSKLTAIVKRQPYNDIYVKGVSAYNAKRYPEAIKLISAFLSKDPGLAEAYQIRAYCNYYVGQYQASITDINQFLGFGNKNFFLVSLRGICYRALGNNVEACNNFKRAAENGNPDGISNFGKYCK